ncbi:MAG: hypothetical protein AB7R89_13705 [Dehalococcoidia bacterium]
MAEDVGALLAAVQLAGHKAIDRLYRDIANAIHAAILRRATPDARGILRLSLPARAAILTDLGRELDEARPLLFTAIMESVQEAERVVGIGAPALPPRDPADAIRPYGIVWRSLGTDRASVVSQTGALLVRGIAAGVAASVVANEVKQFYSPWFSQYRDEAGKLLHTERAGAVKHWPGRAGMASAHARTVMLTETTAAHSRTQLGIALYNDQLMQYTLSYQHDHPDECTDLSRADNGFGGGVYTPDSAPRVPRHPRCRCFYTRVDRPKERAA